MQMSTGMSVGMTSSGDPGSRENEHQSLGGGGGTGVGGEVADAGEK